MLNKRYNSSAMNDTTILPKTLDDLTALVVSQQKKLDHQSLFIEQLLE